MLRISGTRTGHEGQEKEWICISTLSLTSKLDGGGCLTPCPEALPPFYRRLCGTQAPSGTVQKISHPPVFFFDSLVLPQYFTRTCICVSIFLYFFFFAFCLYYTTRTTQTSMPLAEFKPGIPASDLLRTLALDRSFSGICLGSMPGLCNP